MLTEERWSAILELVEKEKAISVTELEKELGVSASTIRRDLTQLHMMGKLLKVHGGATSIGQRGEAENCGICCNAYRSQ